MSIFAELSLSTVSRLNHLHGLIIARRANAQRILHYLEDHRHELSDSRRAELADLLDETLASLDIMDADYTMIAGSPCADDTNYIN